MSCTGAARREEAYRKTTLVGCWVARTRADGAERPFDDVWCWAEDTSLNWGGAASACASDGHVGRIASFFDVSLHPFERGARRAGN